MTDDQIKQHFGVEETRQMLEFREQVKSQMTPDLWEQNMAIHKKSLQTAIDALKLKSPFEAADIITYRLDRDPAIDEDQREVWKALVLIAAFEMQEF